MQTRQSTVVQPLITMHFSTYKWTQPQSSWCVSEWGLLCLMSEVCSSIFTTFLPVCSLTHRREAHFGNSVYSETRIRKVANKQWLSAGSTRFSERMTRSQWSFTGCLKIWRRRANKTSYHGTRTGSPSQSISPRYLRTLLWGNASGKHATNPFRGNWIFTISQEKQLERSRAFVSTDIALRYARYISPVATRI